MNEVACASGVELLMDYLEGALPESVRAALDAHVLACAKCQAFVASYVETPRILREATDASLPEDLRQRLQTFIRAQRRSPSR